MNIANGIKDIQIDVSAWRENVNIFALVIKNRV